MKTVMKKIFSLMLVAVLLVSAVPTAFAESAKVECPMCHQVTAELKQAAWAEATCTNPQKDAYECTNAACGHQYAVEVGSPLPHSEVTDAAVAPTCTTTGLTEGKHCSVCGTVTVAQTVVPASHTEVVDAAVPATCSATGLTEGKHCSVCGTVTVAQTTLPIDPTAHSWGEWATVKAASCTETGVESRVCALNNEHRENNTLPKDPNAHNYVNGVCTLCQHCKFCKETGKHITNCIYYCNGATNCPNDPTIPSAHNEGCLKTKCNKNGCTLAYGHTGECSVPCTVTAGCVLKQGHTGSCNTPCTFTGCTLGYQHTGDHSNACAICGLPKIKSPEHKANCDYYYVNAEPETRPGDSNLEIWVNLHTANVETKTRLLTTYKNLSENTLIHEFISDRRDEIDDMLVNYYGKDYDWSGHVYTSAKADHALKTTARLGEGAAVYINAYTYQDLVYVYVHTDRSYNNERVILFEGKQIGDVISRSEISAVVGKYFSVSSMKIYNEEDWKKVVQGKSVDSRDNLKVTEEPFHIDVLISGSAIAGSGYTADSTNPKTGDMIMAPAIIMCASIGALATLFYLNKKRAI